MTHPITLVALALTGAFGWTFLEYLMHRFLGHRWKRNFFGIEHTRHHIEAHYFASSVKKGVFAVIMFAALTALGLLVVPLVTSLAFSGGLIGGYVLYEVLHRRNHTHPPRNAYGHWRRRHHFWHHFGDARVNHGVSVPIWDMVFGTYVRPDTIQVPRKLAMHWLLDEEGELRGGLEPTYALRGRKAK